MLDITRVKTNPKYVAIISLLEMFRENNIHRGLELKHFRVALMKNPRLDKDYVDKKLDILLDGLCPEAKTEGKELIKQIQTELHFNSEYDLSMCLKRLKPYVKPYPNSKPNKYHLTDVYYSEWLKYAVFRIIRDIKEAKILNHKTFMEDKVVKIDMDGISISVPTDKLDFT